SWTRSCASREKLPPVSCPATRPSAIALASTRFARVGVGQPAAKLRERFVLDRRKVALLERRRAAPLEELLERADHFRVELDAIVTVELFHRFLVTDGLAVDAVRRHGFVRVGREDDAGAERDLLAFQTAGVAAPVVVLVMREHDRYERPERGRRL